MKTNNRQGRSIALIVGVYFIAKSVLNLILGGSVLDVIIAAAEAALLYTGLMYVNCGCCAFNCFKKSKK